MAVRNYNSVFDTWKTPRIIAFWLVTASILSPIVFLNVPVGIAFLGIVFFLPIIWKDPDDDGDPTTGMMVWGSRAYKIASYVSMLKNKHRSEIYTPTVMFGFGPPEDDIQKELTRSFFFPPTRLSAYWALFFGISTSLLDFVIHPYVFPIWGDSVLPSFVSFLLSAVGFFAAYQILWTARRYQLAVALTGVSHTPAVMLHKVSRKDGTLRRSLIRGGVLFGATVLLINFAAFVVSTANVDIPWIVVSSVSLLLGLSYGLFGMNQVIVQRYREEFDHQVERREAWNGIFQYKNALVPFMEMEVPVTDDSEDGQSEDMAPHVWAATFAYPTNGSFVDYVNEAPKIAPSLAPQAEMLAIIPIPKKDPISGRTLQGTVSDKGFRIWWTDELISLGTLLRDHEISQWQKEIAIRVLIADPIANIRQIGRCLVHSHGMMTAPDSGVNIMRVSVVPPDGITEGTFTTNIDKIQAAIGAKWVRAKKAIDGNGRSVIELFVGDGRPNDPSIVFPKGTASSKYLAKLMSAEWEYAFAVNKITSPQGSPALMLSRSVTERSNEFVFDLPPGVSLRDIKKTSDAIKTSSGNTFMEIQEGVIGEKTFSRREKREVEKYKKMNSSVSQFTVVAAPEHPLEEVFYFKDYQNELITGREPGVAKISWSPGVQSDGTLATHSFASDMAHLVLAGSSGSGKSVLIYSMICQLAANNDPRDLQIWIIDPKIGFQEFQLVDSVTRYVDNWTPKPDVFFESCRDMLKDAVEEMKRRNEIFRFAYDKMEPQQLAKLGQEDREPIDKLGVARRVALKAGPKSDGSPNDLMQPYLVIIIDECALLFTGGIDEETKEIQAEILYYASRLARESRSAGIHVLFATQYPTNASIPSLIKQQSGRIGLMASNTMASMVIIDEPGLEDLYIRGTGKVQSGKSYRDFRGFLLEDGENDVHSMREILDSLPRRNPTPLDGLIYEKHANGDSQGVLPGDPGYIDMPEADESVFRRWQDTPGSSAPKLDAAIEAGKADRVRGMLDLVDSMSDEEFLSMSLDEFKSKVLKHYN